MFFTKKKMDETPKINPNTEEQATQSPKEKVESPVEQETPKEVEELDEEEQGKCPKCNGRGLLDPETACDNCEGSGKV
jgi:RecJ-like exonuclease